MMGWQQSVCMKKRGNDYKNRIKDVFCCHLVKLNNRVFTISSTSKHVLYCLKTYSVTEYIQREIYFTPINVI